MTRAVVLLSGGLDSTTCLAYAIDRGFDAYALTFRYGQRHEAEIAAAAEIASTYGVAQHVVANIDLRVFGGSALTADLTMPKGRAVADTSHGVPITYVPARNTVFLSFALAWAEVLGANHIFIGVNALDYSGYPDCRPEYIGAFQSMANLATKAGIEGSRLTIHTPLIDLTKAEIIRLGLSLGVDYSRTRTCYDPASDGSACGQCDACLLRAEGFSTVGMIDPAPYQSREEAAV